MSFKDDILSASEDTKEGRFSLENLCNIPESRFNIEPFKFVAFSADLKKLNMVVIITTLISLSFFLTIGFIWGVNGFVASMLISTLVNISYTFYMIKKRKSLSHMYEDINDGLSDGSIVIEGNYMKVADKNDTRAKLVLNRISEVVNYLYYDGIYKVYKDSAETSSVTWWLTVLFCVLLVYVTQSTLLAYVSVALLASRLVYDVVRLHYIRTGITTLGLFYDKLRRMISEKKDR